MLSRVGDSGASKTDADQSIKTEQLLGSDIGSWVATIAKMNMYIHGDGKTNIHVANGLTLGDRSYFQNFNKGLSSRVDVVLTNPPLGETSHVVAREDWLAAAMPGDQTDPNILLDRLGVVPMRIVEEDKLELAESALAEDEQELEELESKVPDEAVLKMLALVRRRVKSRTTRILSLKTAIAKGDVTREPVNKAMKGGALFLGAIADYLKRIRDPDALPEWRGGCAAVVVDEAILNTPEYGPVRAFIHGHFYVKAVISVGRQAFKYLAHTDAKTSIIFVTRKPEDGKEQVEPIFYAHAERVGYNALGNWVGDDLPRVRELYAQFKDIVLDNYQGAWFNAPAAMAAIEIMPSFAAEFYAAADKGGKTRLDFYNARYVQRVRELRERFGEPEHLGDYLEVTFREHPEPNRRNEYEFAEVNRIGTVRFKALQSVKYAPSELWIVKEGDLVLSGIDAVVGAIAVAGSDVDGMVMSQEMFSYHVKDPSRASAVYLQLLLRSHAARELIEGLITGTSNRTRLENPWQLLHLPIPPLPPIDEQMQIASIQIASIESRRASEDYEHKVAETIEAVWRH